ncbi:right-handed parallel beta-helix repeat-containing protein [Chitinophaga pollutisoli]|uniref:Right-handed parallel beta-helix repeat-containing protein n=1 Tax=Chitinophaga pollutisoli TaxID=3133966 RepID=A0ABZ2YT45_9BACT
MQSTSHFLKRLAFYFGLVSGILPAAVHQARADALTGLSRPSANIPAAWPSQSTAADYVLITDYGAIGDGNIANAGVNTTAMNTALATGKTVKIPYTAAGFHFGTNQITVGSGQIIEGESQVLLKSTATTSLFRMTGFELTSGISNVSIDMTGSGASSTAIRFGTNSAVPVYRVRLSKIKFSHCVEAIGDEAHATNYVVDIIIDDCMAWQTRGRQIYNRRSRGFFLIRSTNVDFTSDPATVTWEGIRLEDYAGLELERVDVVGWGLGPRVYNPAIRSIVLNNGIALWLTRVFADSVIGDGIFINNTQFVFSLTTESSLSLGIGIILSNVEKGVFTNTMINGSNGIPGAAAGAGGLYVENCRDNIFTNTYAFNCTGAGIYVTTGSVRNTFMNNSVNANGFGLALQGNAATTKFIGGSMNGNTTAVANGSSGAGNMIRDMTGYNPVGAASVTTGGSPWTYTAGISPETVYFSASTGVSAVTRGGVSILPAALGANVPFTAVLSPGESIVVTYTGTLSAKKLVQ